MSRFVHWIFKPSITIIPKRFYLTLSLRSKFYPRLKHWLNNIKIGYAKIDEEKAENSKSRSVVVSLMSILVVAALVFVYVHASVGSNDNAHRHRHVLTTISKVANSAYRKARYPERCILLLRLPSFTISLASLSE
ncbi:hypothetical protein SUGI_0648220 [Cryptomeria japonica]|nr:hypothetical protein SUGI_0648220 [Cryptomeria japonica]